MNRIATLVLASVVTGAVVFFSIPLVAQVPGTTASGQTVSTNGEAVPDLTLAKVETALAAVEKDTGIEDAAKSLLRPKYKQAIDALNEATSFAAATAECRATLQTGRERIAELRAGLQDLPSAEGAAKVSAPSNAEDLQKEIDSRRAALNELNEGLAKATAELARVKGRPAEISARLPEARRELSDLDKQWVSPELADDTTSPGRVADRILLQARRSRLLSELEMLKKEQLSQSVHEELLQAQFELKTRQAENAAVALGTLETLLHDRLAGEAKRVRSLAERMPRDVPEDDEAAQALAAEVRSWAKQFEEVVESQKRVMAAHDNLKNRHEGLNSEYESICEQVELGSGGVAMAQVLLDLQRRALKVRADTRAVQLPSLDAIRVASLQVAEALRKQADVEKQFGERPSDAAARLVSTRREVLEKLRTQYGNLIRALAVLEGDRRQYLDKAEEIWDYVWKQLLGFGMKSCPAISVKTVADIPAGLRWAFGSEHWAELGHALQRNARRMPVVSTGIVLAVVVLLLLRRRIDAALQRTGIAIRRISTDRYVYTGEALAWTFLLAIPIPLLIGCTGWVLQQTASPSDWMRGLAHGLRISAKIALAAGFLAAVCRPGGLGIAHFGWKKETVARFRGAIGAFTVVYISALLVTLSCAYGEASRFFASLGVSSFMLAHVWAAIVLWQLFRGADGILAMLASEYPTHVISRWRSLWFALVLACPLALVILAGVGYLIAAFDLSIGLLTTIVLVAGGEVLYCLVLRWFMIKQRTLALAEALERRRARQEAATSEEAGSEEQERPSEEVVTVDAEDEEELDLDSVTKQTRQLLRLLFGVGVAIAVIVFWSQSFPVIETVDAIPIPLAGGLTLLGLAKAILIVVVTFIGVRNLPGLLELAVLRATMIEAGTRNAISTLCQYAVTAVGIATLLNVLNVDWAKFGWIAAALSVGLGFGLQEVVANFVCGLILLFERPIRVGDVVTVEGMTGTVTRIDMRATTITNWDRQEFVVPNKTLITNTILNWTLSTPVNRVVIPVGVAYGSDTEHARQILLEAAADHPNILDDPAPMATFEQFADSSLNLILRAYLPDLDNRLGTITELHTEIDKRFAAAGIEIAFPQRDLHLRNGWEGTRRANLEGNEKEIEEAVPRQAR